MALKIKSVSIGERDKLEPMLVANPKVIEDGLRVITHLNLGTPYLIRCEQLQERTESFSIEDCFAALAMTFFQRITGVRGRQKRVRDIFFGQ